jgi:hypothetical protein
VIYATTYDTLPLWNAPTPAQPKDVSTYGAAARSLGVTHVLINASELARYQRSGFLDPRIDGERMTQWLQRDATLVGTWPTGQALLKLR